MTALVLRRRKTVRRDRLLFGAPTRLRRTGRGERTLWFQPGSIFGVTLWRSNAFGTASWRLFVARAGRPGQPLTRLPGVHPAAEALAVFRGVERVRRALKALRGVEAAGVALSDIPASWWRRFQQRVVQNMPVKPPTAAQLVLQRARRRAE